MTRLAEMGYFIPWYFVVVVIICLFLWFADDWYKVLKKWFPPGVRIAGMIGYFPLMIAVQSLFFMLEKYL